MPPDPIYFAVEVDLPDGTTTSSEAVWLSNSQLTGGDCLEGNWIGELHDQEGVLASWAWFGWAGSEVALDPDFSAVDWGDHARLLGGVPIRMTEAWLLIDEPSLRRAAGAPSATSPLDFPRLRRLESLADPKAVLRELLVAASGTTGRRRDRFDVGAARLRLADLVEDWSPLRELAAFRQLEADTAAALVELGATLRPAG